MKMKFSVEGLAMDYCTKGNAEGEEGANRTELFIHEGTGRQTRKDISSSIWVTLRRGRAKRTNLFKLRGTERKMKK